MEEVLLSPLRFNGPVSGRCRSRQVCPPALIVSAALLILNATCGAQPQAPVPVPWLKSWRDATVALGKKVTIPSSTGDAKPQEMFLIGGTGVLFRVEGSKVPWLVTAKHVVKVSPEPDAPMQKSIRLRFSWFESRSVTDYLGIEIPLEDAKGTALVVLHDSADLACFPLNISVEEAGAKSAPALAGLEDMAKSDEIFAGASTMILGYPSAIEPTFWTRAVLRGGIISWVSPANPDMEPILVDSTVTYGHSGGPAFRVPTGLDQFGNFSVGGRPAFLGIVSQLRYQPMLPTIAGKPFPIKGPEGRQVDFNSLMSIGVLEPPGHVRQLLEKAAILVKANQ